jgi:enamine deaminase RidA (YjgF/YER057c/UK114 family)
MSRGVIHGGVLYSSGLVDAEAADVSGQTKNILARIDALLEEAGTNRSRMLFVNIWLADISTFGDMNAVWDGWVDKANPPARATVESKLAEAQFKVEIAFTAAL